MKYDYSLYVHNAIKEALADKDYESLSAKELLLLCQLLSRVCWFPSSDKEGSPHVCEKKSVQVKLERITDVVINRCGSTKDLLEYAYLLKAIHLLNHVPFTFIEGDSIDLDGRIVEEVLRNPDCDFRILHTMFYAINNGILPIADDMDSDAEETESEDRTDRYDFEGADDLLIKSLHSYEDSQNIDGSWSGISAEEAYSRISVVSLYANFVENINPIRIVSTAYAHYAQQPCTTPTLLLAKYEANGDKYKYDKSGNEQSYFFEKASEMLASPCLAYADSLRLQYILLHTGSYLEE